MPTLKHYRKRIFYRFDSLFESLYCVIYHLLFVKKPPLRTFKALLYKKPIVSTLIFNNFAILLNYLNVIFFKFFLKKDIILTSGDMIEIPKSGNNNIVWPISPFLIKKNTSKILEDKNFTDKIFSSYQMAIKNDDLKLKNTEWWEENKKKVQEFYIKDNSININNLEKFLSLNYDFDLFKESSPLNNLKGLKKINTYFKLIFDYHRFSDYMNIDILRNISESSVGNINAPLYRNQIISSRILSLGYVISQIKNFTNYNYDSHFRFMDIGGGFGNLSRLMLSFFNKSKCILIDLPEICITSAYYLKLNFPKKKIVLFSDVFDSKGFSSELISEADILIIPSWSIKYLPTDFVNLTINTASLGEMTKDYGNYYIKQLSRITNSYFYSSNRTDPKNSIWNDGYGHYNFNLDGNWLPIIYNHSPTWHLEYLGKKTD